MLDIIYFATPYSHADADVVKLRFTQTAMKVAELVAKGHVVISPVTYGHILLDYHNMPSDWEFWKNFCQSFLYRCSKLIVYKLEGWDKSSGVAGEIELAKELGIEIEYLEPDQI